MVFRFFIERHRTSATEPKWRWIEDRFHDGDDGDEEAPPLKLGISVTVDLGKNTVSELKFTVNYKNKISEPLS